MAIIGTNGNDTKTGTNGADDFNMSQGGADNIAGLDGADTIYMGSALTAADTISGGAGLDTVILEGAYPGLVFGAKTMTGVEKLVMQGNFSYSLTMHDANVWAGKELVVDAQALGAGHSLTFDGSAETNGYFTVYSSYGDDSIIGGKGGDYFVMGMGGADTVRGGDGGDVFSMGNTFGTDDVVDGGAGGDFVYLHGAYAAPIVLNGSNLIDIESVYVLDGHDYTVSVQDSLLAAGEVFNLNAASLGAGHRLFFFGGAETDGSFDINDGAGNDQIIGSKQGDLFRAYQGGDDYLSGGAGDDYFLMGDKLTSADVIYGGAGTNDGIDLNGDYSAGVTFADDGLAGIERFTLRENHTYKLVFADGNLNTGERMLISGGGKVFLDASAETDASYDLYDTAGDDTLIGGGGSDSFRLFGGGNDQASGGGGGDSFSFGAPITGHATIDGGAGGDIFYFTYSAVAAKLDTTLGELKLGSGFTAAVTSVESAYGSAFGDVLKGDAGYNFFSAGAGNDLLLGGGGGDNLVGGAGFDRASYAGSAAGVAVNLGAGTASGGDAQGDTLSEIEALTGSSFADTLTGDGANNRLEGAAGDDRLRGMLGADKLLGGGGADRFVYGSVNESKAGAADTILDFSHAQGDRIALSMIDADTTLGGNQAFSFIGNAAFSDAGQLRFANGVLEGDVNGDGTADLVINLTGVASLVAGDFFL